MDQTFRSAPADYWRVFQFKQDLDLSLSGQLLDDRLPRFRNCHSRVTAGVFSHHPVMELFRVKLLRRMFEMRIILVFDRELLDQILGWKIGESLQPDYRYGMGCLQKRSRRRRVSISRLEINQGLIVVRSVPWNRHDDTRAIIWFHEASREDWDRVAGDRVPDGLPQQLVCLDLAFYGNFVILVLKLLHRLSADDPQLFVHLSSNIGGFRVDPEIGDPEHGLRPQSRSRIEHPVLLELHRTGFSYIGFHGSLRIHDSHCALVVRTPCYRMRSPRDQSFPVQGQKVPFDIPAIQRVDGRELSAPVDGESDLHHSLLDIVTEVGRSEERRVGKD